MKISVKLSLKLSVNVAMRHSASHKVIISGIYTKNLKIIIPSIL